MAGYSGLFCRRAFQDPLSWCRLRPLRGGGTRRQALLLIACRSSLFSCVSRKDRYKQYSTSIITDLQARLTKHQGKSSPVSKSVSAKWVGGAVVTAEPSFARRRWCKVQSPPKPNAQRGGVRTEPLRRARICRQLARSSAWLNRSMPEGWLNRPQTYKLPIARTDFLSSSSNLSWSI